MIIAVDGPAASGKGTLARRLAEHFGLLYLDTGKTYRGVALRLIETNTPLDAESAAVALAQCLDFEALDDPRAASDAAGEGASRIAVMPRLREALVVRQRAFAAAAAEHGRGAVLDGRDIGTVVLPGADVKLFITADVAERARRRSRELHGGEAHRHYDALLADLKRRDARDTGRTESPLRPAADAHVIDTTALDADGAFEAAVQLVEKALAR